MDGVTILSQETQTILETWQLGFYPSWFLILGIIICIPLLWYMVNNTLYTTLPVIIILSLLFCIIFTFIRPVTKEQIVYKVTVEDSVKLNEFYQHYEIQGQDGKIYLVTERDTYQQ
jgi:hypothetical protein